MPYPDLPENESTLSSESPAMPKLAARSERGTSSRNAAASSVAPAATGLHLSTSRLNLSRSYH